jgi:predicted amidohydrolase
MMANEGSYPENARALALNGAEVVYRASYPHPATGNEYFEIQSRARALDNNLYVVAPNMGTYYLTADDDTPIDTFGGRSFIIDYKGRIVGRQDCLRRRHGDRQHERLGLDGHPQRLRVPLEPP